ncbi:MAG: DUF2339 domain-containing protein, partial [Lachnospiraceae bacterium]|nr:DUF2339 domain-containing protein [Lachnospiraceae bacterium]
EKTGTSNAGLVDEIREYMKDVKDPAFMNYLRAMEQKALAQQAVLVQMESNLKENHAKYLAHLNGAVTTSAAQPVATEKTPVAEQPVLTSGQSTEQADPLLGRSIFESGTETARPDAADSSKTPETAAIMTAGEASADGWQADGTGSLISQTNEAHADEASIHAYVENLAGAGSEQQTGVNMVNSQAGTFAAPGVAQAAAGNSFDYQAKPPVSQAPEKKQSLEFHFGGMVLSIVGAVLVILSMILFGKNYMDTLSQGIALYVLGAVVIAFSEIVLQKHLESFSKVVSGIGLGILYTATILNYLYLGTMSATVAILVTIGVSVFALLFARHKDSGLLRIIGILGCYISFLPIRKFEQATDFIIPAVILLIVNALYLCLPNKTFKKALPLIHGIANILMACYFIIMLFMSNRDVKDGASIAVCVFLVGLIVIDMLIGRSDDEGSAMSILALIGEIVLSFLLLLWVTTADSGETELAVLIVSAVLLAAAMGFGFFLDREKTNFRWAHLYILSIFVLGITIGKEHGAHMIAVACVLLCFKVLSAKEELAVANLIASLYAAWVFISGVEDPSNMQYLILAVLVLSVFYLHTFKAAHEIIMMMTLQAYVVTAFDEARIIVPLGLLFLLACLVLFAFFESMRDKYFEGVKIFGLVVGGLWVLGSIAISAEKYSYIALTIVLLLGLALIFLLFGKIYAIGGEKRQNIRNMVLAGYFTWMIIVYRIDKPVITSILLMVLAIVCVGAGFFVSQKPLRLYGLVLSLFVCAKLLFSDFADSSSGDKVILSFVVGILAIGISYLYMRLEGPTKKKAEGE